LKEIEAHARGGSFAPAAVRGKRTQKDVMDDYVEHLLSYVDVEKLKPFRVACNPGNGCAGPVLERLAPRLPFRLVTRFAEPDGTFPNGVPNPLLPENRAATADLVRESGADFGVAWDGDFDRCFLFDERGEFIEGYYIVGLLAQAVLRKHPGATIMHDPRLVWNTVDIVQSMGGRPFVWKTGHAFIKEKMREVDAAYGGEMSAHHYFRDFSYCDSGMIPWLLIAQLLSESGAPLSQLVAERIKKFPCSGEINRRLQDPEAALARLEAHYSGEAVHVDHIDGLSMEFDRWRFNVRKSNTEPLVRLNVETRGDRALLEEKTREVLSLLGE
ncbi:MAG: phosphomannomutase, partial [Firmicutes bacterium ZCTH02-B6]